MLEIIRCITYFLVFILNRLTHIKMYISRKKGGICCIGCWCGQADGNMCCYRQCGRTEDYRKIYFCLVDESFNTLTFRRVFFDRDTPVNETCMCRKVREGRCCYFLPCCTDYGKPFYRREYQDWYKCCYDVRVDATTVLCYATCMPCILQGCNYSAVRIHEAFKDCKMCWDPLHPPVEAGKATGAPVEEKEMVRV
jgi:hypothetical protein